MLTKIKIPEMQGANLPAATGGEQIEGKNGAPEEIRTPNLLIRSQVLYPIELRAHAFRGRRTDHITCPLRFASHNFIPKSGKVFVNVFEGLRSCT